MLDSEVVSLEESSLITVGNNVFGIGKERCKKNRTHHTWGGVLDLQFEAASIAPNHAATLGEKIQKAFDMYTRVNGKHGLKKIQGTDNFGVRFNK